MLTIVPRTDVSCIAIHLRVHGTGEACVSLRCDHFSLSLADDAQLAGNLTIPLQDVMEHKFVRKKHALSVEFKKVACWKSTTRWYALADPKLHLTLVRLPKVVRSTTPRWRPQ